MKFLLLYVSCLNCRHYQPSLLDRNFHDMGKCLLYPKVEKRVVYPYADKVRQNETQCGIEGKDFFPL